MKLGFDSQKAAVTARQDRLSTHPEFKDPCIYALEDGTFRMCASRGHVHPTAQDHRSEQWDIGLFAAENFDGPWQEIGPLHIAWPENPCGFNLVPHEACAPAITCRTIGGAAQYDLYVQSGCFQPDSAILHGTSNDGLHYNIAPEPLISVQDMRERGFDLQGLYDASVSEVREGRKTYEYLTFSGYQTGHGIGRGDIYSLRREKRHGTYGAWYKDSIQCLLTHDQMAEAGGAKLHNQIGQDDYEWGLEGAKITQLADRRYMMVGVCFLPAEVAPRGSRQRVFMAAASSPNGPYHPVGLPFEPHGPGENGHPDAVCVGEHKVGFLYQQRLRTAEDRDGQWHLCSAQIPREELLSLVEQTLKAHESAAIGNPPPRYTRGQGAVALG